MKHMVMCRDTIRSRAISMAVTPEEVANPDRVTLSAVELFDWRGKCMYCQGLQTGEIRPFDSNGAHVCVSSRHDPMAAHFLSFITSRTHTHTLTPSPKHSLNRKN